MCSKTLIVKIRQLPKLRYAMAKKMTSFESLGAVSCSPSKVTMAVSLALCGIFSVKEWCDLDNRVRVRSRSLEMAPFDRSHTSSH